MAQINEHSNLQSLDRYSGELLEVHSAYHAQQSRSPPTSHWFELLCMFAESTSGTIRRFKLFMVYMNQKSLALLEY